MKNKLFSLMLASLLFTSLPVRAEGPLEGNLVDVSYQFDQTKLDASDDAFHFLRSFVDYYYNLIAANSKALRLSKATSGLSGWCVGDAHPENFGTLIQEDGKEIFTMNDMDDAGPCPVAYDFLRLLVSSRLHAPKLNIETVVSSYQQGLNLEMVSVPAGIQSLMNEGKKLGEAVNPKNIEGGRLKRKKDTNEVSSEIRTAIINDLQKFFSAKEFLDDDIKVIDILSTSKVGGGSGGLLRYEILCSRSSRGLVHLELKELTAPGITSVATEKIPDQTARMMKTVKIEQGAGASHFYNVFSVNGKTMLLRPKFAGNIGIDLGSNLLGNTEADTINYEAYILGRIHAQTVDVKAYLKALEQVSPSDWEVDVKAFTKQFNKKYDQLSTKKSLKQE